MRRLLIPTISIGVGLGLGIFLGWLAIRGVNLGDVLNALAGISPLWAAAAVFFYLLATYVRAIRWRLLWVNEDVKVYRLFLIENASLGVNNIVPIRAAAEGVQFGVLTLRDGKTGGSVIATMMMTRILDMAFTVVFILLALAFLDLPFIPLPVIVIPLVVLIIVPVILLNAGRILRRFPWLRHRVPFLADMESMMSAIWGQKSSLALSFGATCLFWFILGLLGWSVSQGFNLELPFRAMLVTVIGSILFATSVPGPPGAIGTFEFAAVYLLGLWDVPREAAVTAAIMLHAMLFLPPILFAVTVLPHEGFKSVNDIRGLVERWRKAREAGGSHDQGSGSRA